MKKCGGKPPSLVTRAKRAIGMSLSTAPSSADNDDDDAGDGDGDGDPAARRCVREPKTTLVPEDPMHVDARSPDSPLQEKLAKRMGTYTMDDARAVLVSAFGGSHWSDGAVRRQMDEMNHFLLPDEIQMLAQIPFGSAKRSEVERKRAAEDALRRAELQRQNVRDAAISLAVKLRDERRVAERRWLDERCPDEQWLRYDHVSDINKPMLELVGSRSAIQLVALRLGGTDARTNAAWKWLCEDADLKEQLISDFVDAAPPERKASVRCELEEAFESTFESGDPLLRLFVQRIPTEELRYCHAWCAPREPLPPPPPHPTPPHAHGAGLERVSCTGTLTLGARTGARPSSPAGRSCP